MKRLSENEKNVLKAMFNNAKEIGDTGVEFVIEDVAQLVGKSKRSVSATMGSLANKGYVTCNEGISSFDGELTEKGLHEVEEINKVKQEVESNKNTNDMNTNDFDTPVMDNRIVRLNEVASVKMSSINVKKRPAARQNKEAAKHLLNNWDNKVALEYFIDDAEMKSECNELWNIAVDRYKQLCPKPSKASKTKEAKSSNNKKNKVDRKVGDVHPKHPEWVWTEYKPGKFDWRTNPKDKKQGRRTDIEQNKQPKTKTSKPSTKEEKKAPKEAEKHRYTIDEWVALPTKHSKSKSKMPEAQKEVFKLINKGYRVTADKKFFRNEQGENKACNWASVEAMFKRYGIDYIPEGLVK